jgi:carbon-monoxide dehydrogenase medium subunit
MKHICYRSIPRLEQYFQPQTIDEAVSLAVKQGGEAKFLAGGTSLVPLMRSRSSRPKCLIDLTRIPDLDYISYDKVNGLGIGALVTLREVELSTTVMASYPALAEAAHHVASMRIRNVATVTGNLCQASPSSDIAVSLLALESAVRIVGSTGVRMVPIEVFFSGPGKTVLEHDEVVAEILLPAPLAGSGMAFLRIARTAADRATVNVAAVLTVKKGVCESASIALGGVAPTPIRAKRAEEVLRGKRVAGAMVTEAMEIASSEASPITDIRSTAEYRRELTKVLIRQAISRSLNGDWKEVKG